MPSFISAAHATHRLILCALGASGLMFGVSALAQLSPVPEGKPDTYPAWWFQRDVIPWFGPVENEPARWPRDYPEPDDFAAVNLGQLKHMATQAFLEMEDVLPGGAGQTLSTLWLAPAVGQDDYTAINVGQLKYVAEPFYARLEEVNYTGSPLTGTQTRPWTGIADDYALANIGQLKFVFSFLPDGSILEGLGDPINLVVTPASATSATLQWEVGSNIYTIVQLSEDGGTTWKTLRVLEAGVSEFTVTDLTSIEGSDFRVRKSGNGITDASMVDWMQQYGLDPSEHFDGSQHSDDDGMSDAEEYARGTDPTNNDTDGDGVPDDQDAVGNNAFFTFNAAPEVSYAVIDLGPGSVLALNNRGDYVLSNSTGLVFQRNGASSSTLPPSSFVALNNMGTIAYQPLNNPSTVVTRVPEGDDIPEDYSNAISLAFGDSKRFDETSYSYTEFIVTPQQPRILGLDDAGAVWASITAGLWANYVTLDSGGELSGGWLGFINAYSEKLIKGTELIDGTGSSYVLWYWGYSWLEAPSRSIQQLYDMTPEQRLERTFDQPMRGVTVATLSRKGDWAKVNAGYTHQYESTEPFLWEFSDGTTYEETLGTNYDSPLHSIALGRLPGQEGLWKAWNGDSYYSPDTSSALSLSSPEQGEPIIDYRTGTPLKFIEQIGSNGLILSASKIWRNGRFITKTEMIGENTPWSSLTISKMSDDGFIFAGIASRPLDSAGQPLPANKQQRSVLLVPVELTLSHPVVTSPEPPEYVVNADVASVLLTASVLGAADGTLIGWEIETGEGTLSHAESATVDGFAQTTLTTSTQVGSTYQVTARVKKLIFPAATPGGPAPEFDFEALGLAATEPTLRQTTDDITVIPGFAAAITVTRENEDGGSADPLTADGHSRRVLVASVRDAFGQPVAENTPVNWHLSGSGRLVDIEEFADADGLARAVLVAGDAIADQKIRVEADSFEIIETVPNLAVTGTLVASASSLDLAPGNATTTLTLSVPEAMNGAPVRWFTSLGAIENPVTTVANGEATATLRASGGRIGPAIATASVGGAVYLAEVAFTSSAPITVEVEHPVIVGDASSDGTHPVPRADGTMENVAYRTSTPVHIRAPAYAGQTATVRFGKVKPAADLLYRFDELSAGSTPSETGDHPATVSGATLDTTRRHEGAASLFFDGEDAVLGVPDHTAVRLQSGLVISLWVHAADSGGSLVAKAGEYDLSIDTEGRATFTVQTTAGPTTLVGPTVPLDAWTQVRAEYRAGGELRLSVAGTTTSVTTPGQPQTGSALVLVGENFGGWLDRLAFEAGEQFIAGTGLNVLGVDLADQVVLDANGEATVTLAGNGGDTVNAANPVLGVGIRVSINPELTLSQSVFVTTRENYAVLDATLGHVRLSVNGGTELISPERRAEILAACLLNLEGTGQRAAAVPFVATGTLAERQQFGFRVALWMQQTSDGATNIKVLFQNTESLPLTAEQRHLFEENLTQMLQDAIRFRSDAAAEASLVERWEGFLGTLAGLSLGGDFPALVLAADNNELFHYFGELHEEYGPALIGELASLGQQEAVRNPRFLQRVVVGLKKIADVITGEWQQQVVTSTENWLRDRTMQAVADGKLDEVDAYFIGFAWGLCSEAFATGQMTNQFAANGMMEQLTSTVVAAWNGSQEARDALKTMIPVYGLTVMNDSTRALAEQGQHFDAGMGSAQEATGAVGTFTGGAQLLKAGTVAIIVKRAGKKAAKGGPPPLPASFGFATSLNYRTTFHTANPGLRGKVIVHHAVEQQALTRYPGLVTPQEIHSLQNLRGIPTSIDTLAHRRIIRFSWDGFYEKYQKLGRSPTKSELLEHATMIDDALGNVFEPKIRR